MTVMQEKVCDSLEGLGTRDVSNILKFIKNYRQNVIKMKKRTKIKKDILSEARLNFYAIREDYARRNGKQLSLSEINKIIYEK